jgi:hypothetical protein
MDVALRRVTDAAGRDRTKPMSQTVSREFAEAEVQAESGETRALGEAWRERTAVLAFLRHFG